MIYIDTNILIYSIDGESPYYNSASEIFHDILKQDKAVIHEIVLSEFYSIITDTRKMKSPWPTGRAKEFIAVLLDSVHEIHFLNQNIIQDAFVSVEKYDIKRYNIYDHLLASSMKFHGVDCIATANESDFRRYGFLKEIIVPQRS